MKMAAHRGKRAAQKSLGNEAKIAKMCENVRAGKRGEKESGEEPRGEVFTVERPVSTGQWTNRERVLVFSSRGIDFRTRHLMNDLKNIMPHSKADTKMERKDKLFVVNEVLLQKKLRLWLVCEIKNCNKCIFFEAKKKQDLYMWISNVPHGPSAKFLVQNAHGEGRRKVSDLPNAAESSSVLLPETLEESDERRLKKEKQGVRGSPLS
ncbi:hypothetical protein DNTS_009425 [Danionella cerebrum]|uniref:Ribosome biogenesis protein BRX1 homolog n=1 Tax=Danionella cerebrum TaxID=2873325 RepID=A0A553NIG4_9TELE|nr:hypothetical protein DNTS_009425 [Danionella translucida]TRY65200.1 hypothetical protein DNTS_009425 [Danionella translucida]